MLHRSSPEPLRGWPWLRSGGWAMHCHCEPFPPGRIVDLGARAIVVVRPRALQAASRRAAATFTDRC